MLTAKEIMSKKVITVKTEMPVSELADLLWKNKIGGVPVVDDNGSLVGVVTESDLIDQNKKVHIPTIMTILDSMIFLENPAKLDKELKKMTGTTVGDIYSTEIVTVSENTPMYEVATIMANQKVHTLPVVANDKVLGVIGKADIIRNLYK
jgi:CBS-domain-containing membrane protein